MQLPEYTIRNASVGDASTIRELAYAIWPHTYGSILEPGQVKYMLDNLYSTEALEEQMTRQNQHFILLGIENQAKGFGSYTIAETGNSAKLNKIYLDTALQGQGLGKVLLHAVEAKVSQFKCRALYLNVNRFNPARHFYLAQGFKIIGYEDIPIGPFFMNDYIMRKPLS